MSWVRTSVLSIRSLIRESSFASSSPWYFSLAFLMSFSRVSLKEALQKKTYTSIIYITTGSVGLKFSVQYSLKKNAIEPKIFKYTF